MIQCERCHKQYKGETKRLHLDVLAEILAMLNYGERLEHVRAKQLVTCLYLYRMTIGNRRKALI